MVLWDRRCCWPLIGPSGKQALGGLRAPKLSHEAQASKQQLAALSLGIYRPIVSHFGLAEARGGWRAMSISGVGESRESREKKDGEAQDDRDGNQRYEQEQRNYAR